MTLIWFQPPLSGPSDAEIEAANALLAARKLAVEEQWASTLIECPHCEETQRLKHSHVIQTYWYTEPYGCTGGDYWNAGHKEVVCNECGDNIRIYKADNEDVYLALDKHHLSLVRRDD